MTLAPPFGQRFGDRLPFRFERVGTGLRLLTLPRSPAT